MTVARLPTPAAAPSMVSRSSVADRYLLVLCLVLLGYAVDGRGFAYLFAGEAVLVAGIALLAMTRGWTAVFEIPQILLLIPFWAWGLLRTIPYLHHYRVDAVRDAMLYGYSAFALFVAALIVADPARLVRLLRQYRTFTRLFLVLIPIVAVIYRFMWYALPRWPWT